MPEYAELRKDQILTRIKEIILHHTNGDGERPILDNTCFIARQNEASIMHHCLSRSTAGLIAQGEKRVNFGSQHLEVKAGQVLVTCVDVPSSSVLHDISPHHPFLATFFLLDKKVLADLLSAMPPDSRPPSEPGLNAYVLDPSLDFLETLLRLLEIIKRPEQAPILAPLILRELHYLLLNGPQGAILHDLYMCGARDNRIIDAIAWLKQNPRITISVEELAKKVNMSVSSLHRHFKNITGFSPLQYHKQIRLYEAQRLMLVDNERADMAALAVGYESITQFNREYKRMFGEPPRRDVRRRKDENL